MQTAGWILTALLMGQSGSAARASQSPEWTERATAAMERGARYLHTQQKEDGSFGATDARSGDVGTTSLVIRALYAIEADRDVLWSASKALMFIRSRVQSDGGIYDPGEGLRSFKTAMAIQAIRVSNLPRFVLLLDSAEHFIEGVRTFESGSEEHAEAMPAEAAEQVARMKALADDPAADESIRRAAKFLLQAETAGRERISAPGAVEPENPGVVPAELPSGYVSYEHLPALVYRELNPEDPDVQAVVKALRERFDLTRNPDLTRRFDRRSAEPGKQGIYFNYLVMARVLSVASGRNFVTAAGEKHDWTRELAEQILKLQREDGSWLNDNPRWWEGNSQLTTAYALLTLQTCLERAAQYSE